MFHVVYIIKIYDSAMLRCDFAMSSGERDFLNSGFPCLICYASVSYNISEMVGQSLRNV